MVGLLESRSNAVQVTSVLKQDVKIVNIPQRMVDPTKRNPSLLPRVVDIHETNAPEVKRKSSKSSTMTSQLQGNPVVDHLAAVSHRDGKKQKSMLQNFIEPQQSITWRRTGCTLKTS
jgi:hypothetical protein